MSDIAPTLIDSLGTDMLIVLGLVLLLVLVLAVRAFLHRGSGNDAGGGVNGINPTDIEKMKGTGLLTDEEAKKVRQAMAKRFLDESRKAVADAAKRPKARAAAGPAEEWLQKEVERLKLAGPPATPAAPASSIPDRAPQEAQPAALRPAMRPRLPERLVPMLTQDRDQLEALLAAGFLTPEDLRLIEEHRAANAPPAGGGPSGPVV